MGILQGAALSAMQNMAGAGLALGHSITKANDTKIKNEEAANKASYDNQINTIFGEAINSNENLRDPRNFQKALNIVSMKKNMMLTQREASRTYRNQFKKNSEEYNGINNNMKEMEQRGFEDLRKSLNSIGSNTKRIKGRNK